MARQRPDRKLPDKYLLNFIQSLEREIGDYSLQMILNNAGLAEWRPDMPSTSQGNQAYTSDMASLQCSLREYYGKGARGILRRTGLGMWEVMVEEITGSQKAALLIVKKLPFFVRRIRVLEYLAKRMGGETGQSFVYPMDPNLIFVDHFSDPTLGQVSEEPICWFTVGMIQAALHWITGTEHHVEETSCMAAGGKACRFEIRI